MKCLITGSSGLIGSHLAEFLGGEGHQVFGTFHSSDENLRRLPGITLFRCDVSDQAAVDRIIEEVRPDRIFHLAAQSYPARSWQEPEATFRTNIFGTLYVLEAARKHRPDCRIVVAGSSAEYGPSQNSIREEEGPGPASPYGISKVCGDMLATLCGRAYALAVIRVRPFFVIGPGRASNCCVDFSRRILEIEQGHRDKIEVGNLDAIRDLVDVRDAVKAFWLLAEKGTPGEVYNLCSGERHSIGELLERLIALSGRNIPVVRDPSRFRTLDTPVLVGDNSKLRWLGWQPEIPLDQTLSDILSYWREAAR